MTRPQPYYADESVTLYHADALEVLRSLDDASVDAVCTDPPYGLEFMGREWDGADGFRRSLNGADTGRDSVFGRTSRTSPEYRTSGTGQRGKPGIGDRETEWVSNQGWNAWRCITCGHLPHGGSPCRCENPQMVRADNRWPMYQQWCEAWARECLRVLKPGGHLLAFGGTRTVHRLTCAIEDAGFEIRDSIMWHYASGFPKSLNVNKDPQFCQCNQGECGYGDGGLCGVRQGVSDLSRVAQEGEVTDLLAPVQREGARAGVGEARPQGAGSVDAGKCRVVSGEDERRAEPGMEGRGDVQTAEGQLHRPDVRPLSGGVRVDGPVGRVRDGAPAGDGPTNRPSAAAFRGGQPHRPQPPQQRSDEPGAVPVERGPQAGRGWPVCGRCGKPSIPAGLGTALKPATEPVVVARKPLQGTVAANVLRWGTGAFNIDATRVTGQAQPFGNATRRIGGIMGDSEPRGVWESTAAGRWPPNLVLSHAESDGVDLCGDGCVPGCPIAELDRQSGNVPPSLRTAQRDYGKHKDVYQPGAQTATGQQWGYSDSGAASRFFPVFRYEPKADSAERPRVNGVAHPTVKPLALVRWLVRLVTPPGGLALDPFAGSGTTGEACLIEGFRAVLVEREADYLPLIMARLSKPLQPVLFGEVAL